MPPLPARNASRRAVASPTIRPALIALCALGATAWADAGSETEAAAAVIEEVMVTARKRPEPLQRTPISVTAFSAATLSEANMIDLRDIGKYTPGMTFTSYGMGSSEAGAIFLRGIGQSDHMVTTDPGVGLYIDGVYIGRSHGAAIDLLDIERVEVLRGPQGTLFGRNAIGGAISVTTRRPTGAAGGAISLTVGEDGRLNASATAEMPLGDAAAASISVLGKHRDGVGDQVLTGSETGDEDSLSGRVQLHWEGQAAELSLVVEASRARQAAMPHSAYAQAGWLDAATCHEGAASGYRPCPAGARGGVFDSYSLDDLDTGQDVTGVSATVERNVADGLALKSITAIRTMDYLGSLDLDGAPQRIVYYRETGRSDQFSQELQLVGLPGGRLHWIAGLYYFTEDGHNDQNSHEFGSLGHRRTEVRTRAYAAFGQATMALTGRLSLTGGLRHTVEAKDYEVAFRSLDASGTPSFDSAGEPRYFVPPTALDDTWDAVSGTLSLDYAATGNVLVYGTYSRGFRSGGYAARPSSAASVGAYGPEYVNMFELGVKALALGGGLRFNAAVYRNDYEDYQAQVNRIGDRFDTRVLNAAKAEIEGAELELSVQLSPFLRLDAAFAYTDAEIAKVELAPPLEANFSAGHRLPYVSKYSFSLSPRLEVPLDDGAVLLARADYSYRSAFFGQIANSPLEREAGYGLINARVEYRSPGRDWSIALYAINLADVTYARVRNHFPDLLGFAIWNTDRREIGLNAKYEF